MIWGSLRMLRRRFVCIAASVNLLAISSCSNHSNTSVKTTDFPQTNVKWQAIGNCWAYATHAWAESLSLLGSGGSKTLNLSESYHTYRYFQDQLQRPYVTEVQTGGTFAKSMSLFLNYGTMYEGDFLPNEANLDKSETQARAEIYINTSLKSGPLNLSRSPETIISELNNAFGVNINAIASKIIPASAIQLGTSTIRKFSLDEAARTWTDVDWPQETYNLPNNLPAVATLSQSRTQILRRVMRAMNDGHPVIMSWFVDFNAFTSEGVFDLEELKKNGPGKQGYHMTVLEDYGVSGVNPFTGSEFKIGEGEATYDQKNLAHKFGNIDYFIAKNSWGGATRIDRPSYSRFGEKGYVKLNGDYLFSWFKKFDEAKVFTGNTAGLTSFALPPGY